MPTPTFAGFESFVYAPGPMMIDPLALPTNSPVLGWAFTVAMLLANPDLALIASPSSLPVSTDLYSLAVYNLAGDNLVNFAPDQTGRTYFQELRASYGIGNFNAGVLTFASDNGTSRGYQPIEAMRSLILPELQNLKTPWGRAYLGFAQMAGSLWGLS